MKYKWLLILIIILLVGIVGHNYVYKDHRDIKTEHAQFQLTSKELINEFSNSTNEAEKKFLNRTIEINGTITEVNSNTLNISTSVFCQFTGVLPTNIKKGLNITIKGRCIGYDELLEEIKLDQCSIINN